MVLVERLDWDHLEVRGTRPESRTGESSMADTRLGVLAASLKASQTNLLNEELALIF